MFNSFATHTKKIIFTSLLCANINFDVDVIKITRNNLNQHIQEATQQYLLDNDVRPQDIPDNLQAEFEAKVHTIQAELLTMLSQRQNSYTTSYINRYDVERSVRTTMQPFVNKVKNTRSNQQFTTFITSNIWDFFNRPNTTTVATPAPVYHAPVTTPAYTPTYTTPTPPANQISASDLEKRATTLAYKVIECTPDSIPARVVSDFSDKLQKSLKRLRDTMYNANRSYVWQDEVETILLQELQPIVDKIHHKNESCCICLSNYTSGQRIATTSCGHEYHKDCIYQWLNTDANKSCPLCRTQDIIVAKQETMA